MEEIFSEFHSGKQTTGTWLSKPVDISSSTLYLLCQLRKFQSSSFEVVVVSRKTVAFSLVLVPQKLI